MRTYEMTVIFRAADEDFTKGKQLVDELLQKHGVTVEKEDDKGNRILAYPIKRNDKGHYLYREIKSEPTVIVQLERALKLMQSVLKFLIVRKDDQAAPAVSAPKAETPKKETAPAPAPEAAEPEQETEPAPAPEAAEPKQEAEPAPAPEAVEPAAAEKVQPAEAETPEEPKQDVPVEEPVKEEEAVTEKPEEKA